MIKKKEELTLALEDLKPPDRNVRIHTEKQVAELKRSVKMFGQIRRVVVDEKNTILAGNGLSQALRENGETDVQVLRVSGLNEKEKKKLMLADNRIYDLGADDHATIDDFLSELEGDIDIPGFDAELLRSLQEDSEETTERIASYGRLEEATVQGMANAPARSDEGSIDAPDINEPIPEGKAIHCPHCNKVIWL